MNLHVTKATKNRVVTILLETTDFSEVENNMLDQLGEPIIAFEKTYGNNIVKFEKKMRTNFNVRVKFDATLETSTDQTAEYIDKFLEDIQELLTNKMEDLIDQYNDAFKPADYKININN